VHQNSVEIFWALYNTGRGAYSTGGGRSLFWRKTFIWDEVPTMVEIEIFLFQIHITNGLNDAPETNTGLLQQKIGCAVIWNYFIISDRRRKK
jgi:hypothetical protein